MAAGVLLVDGNSLCHRAFHGMSNGDPSGPYVAATVASALGTAWQKHGPFDAIVMAFDSPRNARKDRWPDYKAGRSSNPDELYAQMDLAKQVFADGGVTVVEVDGWEADDLLACGVAEAAWVGVHAWVLTSDRDLLAQASESCTVLRIKTSIHEPEAYDPARVETETGVRPDQYVWLCAFKGDPSDNLPGVDGVGPKTAVSLLVEHGDPDTIWASLDRLPAGVRRRLEVGRDAFDHTVEVMTPNLDLDAGVTNAVHVGFDTDRLVRALDHHGAAFAARRVRRALTTTVQVSDLQTSLF